jgi:hypothetical protein
MFAKHLFLFSHLIKFPFFSAHNTSRRMDSTSEKAKFRRARLQIHPYAKKLRHYFQKNPLAIP